MHIRVALARQVDTCFLGEAVGFEILIETVNAEPLTYLDEGRVAGICHCC